MVLSWNEIKDRALAFSKEWEGEKRERAEKDTFWNEFFNVFGISRRRVATFEAPVKKLNDNYGFIDLFWKGKLLVEHKSGGEDLEKAYSQALDYFAGLKEHELPKYILVSDFAKFKLYDLDDGKEYEFPLSKFVDNILLFGFIAGWKKRSIKEEDPVNIKAAELMGKFHEKLATTGYTGHDLEVYLVRLLFCLFADDTGIFEKGIFEEYIRVITKEDGSDLSYHIAQIFQTLNTPSDKRLKTLDESIAQFPYVNGSLFEENLRIAAFDSGMREMFLTACALDWGEISPAIFGSMFQAAMDPAQRRNLGAHYTSEANILKVVKPLFLDKLWQEFEKIKRSPTKLKQFHLKVSNLVFFDPACGSGNFLIITYRELRLLELEILRILQKGGQMILDIRDLLKVSINNFYGIEIEEFASKVAEVGMWLVEHQMNEIFSLEFGQNIINLPLKESANIVNASSLTINWEEVVPKDSLSYIIGNPPFYGKQYQSKSQKAEMKVIFDGVKGAGVLDYVTAWYIKAAALIQGTDISVGFVSTNSISQGEQTGILWNEMFSKYGVKINFAHRTFQWNNKAKGKAAVHCIIVGFGLEDAPIKYLYDYEDIQGEPHEAVVKNINPYLVDGPNITIPKRTSPICDVPPMNYGSMPNDGGNLVFDTETKRNIITEDPQAEKFIKKFVMGEELINDIDRWALWITEKDLQEVRKIKPILKIIEKVKAKRLASTRAATNKLAQTPYRFGEVRQPKESYIAFPRVSSMRRTVIPITILEENVIAGDKVYTISTTDNYIFGFLTSSMHMAWMRYTAGRMKSDFSYTNQITYNNFPFPKNVEDSKKQKVIKAAEHIFKIRSGIPNSSLSDLYDPNFTPSALLKAHQQLDKAVDKCYRAKAFENELKRIEFLFELYEKYTNVS